MEEEFAVFSILVSALFGVIIGYLQGINERISDIRITLAEIKTILSLKEINKKL